MPEENYQQKKNAILFAVILSITALVVVLIIVLKPEDGPAEQVAQESATASTTEKKSIFSFFKLPDFSSFFGSGNFNSSNMFNVSGSGTKSGGVTSTGNQTQKPDTGQTVEEQRIQYQKQIDDISENIEEIGEELEKIESAANSSPLRGKITISSVRRSTSGKPEDEYITLRAASNLPKETILTGLYLKSQASGQTVEIGKGVTLVVPNQINIEEGIKINPGGTIIVSSGRSPLGYSFRINKCTGYYEQFQNFLPSIQLKCPLLKEEPLPQAPNQLSDSCLDYIDRFPRCTITTTANTPTQNDQTNDCRVFVEQHTGYNNCVRLHQKDVDFYTQEWRVYLNRGVPIWKQKREIIWLVDQNDKFIAQYSY